VPFQFARTPLERVKEGVLTVDAAFFRVGNNLKLIIKVQNNSGGEVRDFDLKFNKNSFGVAISGVAGKLQFPPPGQTSEATLDCQVDKKNLDGKKPPSFPFKVQTAMRSSIEVQYFEIPCQLHCLVIQDPPMTREEFRKFSGMIPAANETTKEYSEEELGAMLT